jgi:hypothetical protein
MSSLPYELPKSTAQKISHLSKITSIPMNLLKGAGELELEAIAAMILYRHMDRLQRIEAMGLIRSVNNRALMGHILNKTLDTTFVNPQWGIWSLSNKELLNDIQFHTKFDSFASYVGVSASVLGTKDMIKDIWKTRKIGKKHWVLIVIWGSIAFNKSELNKAQAELKHRQSTHTSRLY